MSPRLPIVLIVDDDESVRTAIGRLMHAAGLAAETFASAEALLRRGCQGLRGCLILDVRLPGMSGLELQAHLAQSGLALPVIFVTAHDDEEAREQAMRAGAQAFIQKPFDEDVLLSAVRAALNPSH